MKSRRVIELGKKLGGGGEGTVYEVVDEPESAVKIYTVRENDGCADAKATREDQRHARQPAEAPLHDHEGTRLSLLAWLKIVVQDLDRNFAGFLMPWYPTIRPRGSPNT